MKKYKLYDWCNVFGVVSGDVKISKSTICGKFEDTDEYYALLCLAILNNDCKESVYSLAYSTGSTVLVKWTRFVLDIIINYTNEYYTEKETYINIHKDGDYLKAYLCWEFKGHSRTKWLATYKEV